MVCACSQQVISFLGFFRFMLIINDIQGDDIKFVKRREDLPKNGVTRIKKKFGTCLLINSIKLVRRCVKGVLRGR